MVNDRGNFVDLLSDGQPLPKAAISLGTKASPGATGFTRALSDDSQSINQESMLEAPIVLE